MDIGIALIAFAVIGGVLYKRKKDTDKAMEEIE
jgi:hypothetical protein